MWLQVMIEQDPMDDSTWVPTSTAKLVDTPKYPPIISSFLRLRFQHIYHHKLCASSSVNLAEYRCVLGHDHRISQC